MNKLTLDDLLEKVREYNPEGVEVVKKAYLYAAYLHDGQLRESGEPYIIHPLTVAYILSEMHADIDTICAGLLHDTLEDTKITKEDIIEDFNKDVANLVDGVTKISRMNFSTKKDQNVANTRKIITSITSDVRIIIIKLADRLHNMRTLDFKSEYKQKENSMETMKLFVPLSYYIGAYRIKSELEDLSFYYLNPGKYKEIENIKRRVEQDSKGCLDEMSDNITKALNKQGITPEDLKIRTKNIYGIFKRMDEGYRVAEIPDLLALKIMLKEIQDCYQALGIIHKEYHPVNEMFRDYICNPKTNMYQSLHTTVFGPNDRLIQTQIRTTDMDKIASFGLSAYWDINKGNARDVMQESLKNKYQFFESLVEINNVFRDNQEFVNQVERELFADKIYVYTTKGDIIELPKGSTIIDLAYKIHTEIGNTMTHAIVNNKPVDVKYVLQNKDRVQIVTDVMSYGPRKEWEEVAQTTLARRKIREFYKK